MAGYFSPPSSAGGLPGELALIGAILRQWGKDVHARRVDIRQESVALLDDPRVLAFWGDLVGLEEDVLRAYLQRAMRQG
jgi:hypothetical protein